MNSPDIWLVMIGMGVITFGMRISSVLLAGRLPLSKWSRLLRFVPLSVLSTSIFLGLLIPEGELVLSPFSNARLAAGLLAVAAALWTKKVLPTIAVGMGALWILQAIL